ncbi:MAG: glycosyl transferase family protein [Pacificimonas sp.]
MGWEIELAAWVWVITRELLLLAALGFLISGADELFVDVVYIWSRIRRSLTVYRRDKRWSVVDIPEPKTPGRFAIFVPAWDEAAVIGQMLTTLLGTLDHRNYVIFVGLYPNDEETTAVVQNLHDPRLRPVTTSRGGPTTKADCLNHLWRAMLAEEADRGRFKAIVLHDAEDLVHPMELKVFDHLIPRKSMVQLPVVPVRDDSSRWISGHYADEFAEHHGKVLPVREALGAALPSAGVACAFERDALAAIAAERNGAPFNPDALTEDYDLGIHLSRGGRGAFVILPEAGHQRRRRAVATREHFPDTLEAAIRQKTRWLVGIVFQGWQTLGWRGSLADRYMFLRDRKAIPNALMLLIGYIAALLALAAFVARAFLPSLSNFPPIVAADSGLAKILMITLGLLVWRLATRAWFTGRVYGVLEGLLSIPRTFIANMIAILAARRATRRYLGLLFRGRFLTWDKTAHRFPSEPNER